MNFCMTQQIAPKCLHGYLRDMLHINFHAYFTQLTLRDIAGFGGDLLVLYSSKAKRQDREILIYLMTTGCGGLYHHHMVITHFIN